MKNIRDPAVELIDRAYGFNACQASMLVFDPKSTKEEVAAFFPGVHQSYYYELHELLEPKEETVPERDAFGTHWAQVAVKMLRS